MTTNIAISTVMIASDCVHMNNNFLLLVLLACDLFSVGMVSPVELVDVETVVFYRHMALSILKSFVLELL